MNFHNFIFFQTHFFRKHKDEDFRTVKPEFVVQLPVMDIPEDITEEMDLREEQEQYNNEEQDPTEDQEQDPTEDQEQDITEDQERDITVPQISAETLSQLR